MYARSFWGWALVTFDRDELLPQHYQQKEKGVDLVVHRNVPSSCRKKTGIIIGSRSGLSTTRGARASASRDPRNATIVS